MAIRPPPGRAGRLWLIRRLEVARRGADVLEQKRRALLSERQRLAVLLESTESEWLSCARLAVDTNARTLALAGERRLRLAVAHSQVRAEISITHRHILGTESAMLDSIGIPAPNDLVALGGPVAAISAAIHAHALQAAGTYAVVRAGHESVSTELSATNRRLRAIERRWIPQHEHALARLDLSLDESEREDIVRIRWALDSRPTQPTSPPGPRPAGSGD